MLLKTGFTNDYIISNYAIYNTYVIGLLIVPTFLLGAIGTSMLPEISKNINNKAKVKRLFKKTMIFSLIIGVFSNIVLYFSCDFILNLLFNTTDGCNYIRFLAPFFTIFYFESPLSSILQAYNMTGYIMKTTIIGVIIKLVSLTLLSLFHIGIYALILSEVINIFYVVIGNYIKVKQILK